MKKEKQQLSNLPPHAILTIMTDIELLEHYFDLLLHRDKEYDIKHPMSDDKLRFELFDITKNHINSLAENLHDIDGDLTNTFPDYKPIIQKLEHSFRELTTISNEDFDYYLRSLAVDRLIFKAKNAGSLTPEMLSYLIEGLMAMFFGPEEDIIQLTKDTLKTLRGQKTGKLFKRPKEKSLQSHIIEALHTYEIIEEELKKAKQGF